jgi:hypothetical protein
LSNRRGVHRDGARRGAAGGWVLIAANADRRALRERLGPRGAQ